MASATDIEMVDKSYFFWRGGLGILLGIIILAWPGLTVLTLVTFVSIWLLLSGVMSMIGGVFSIKHGGFGWIASILLGILEFGVGAYLLQRPGITTLAIVTLLALVFVAQGIVHVIKTFAETDVSGGHRMLTLIYGALSLIAGVWMWRYPLRGSLAFVWVLGLYVLASGTLLIAMGIQSQSKD